MNKLSFNPLFNFISPVTGRIKDLMLPPLTEDFLWIGNEENVATETLTIASINLPTLTKGMVWQGDDTDRPVATTIPSNEVSYIVQKKDDITNFHLHAAQALQDLSSGILYNLPDGKLKIAEPDIDYVTPAELETEVGEIQAQITTLEGSIAAIEGEIIGIEGEITALGIAVAALAADSLLPTTYVQDAYAGDGIKITDSSVFGIHKDITISLDNDYLRDKTTATVTGMELVTRIQKGDGIIVDSIRGGNTVDTISIDNTYIDNLAKNIVSLTSFVTNLKSGVGIGIENDGLTHSTFTISIAENPIIPGAGGITIPIGDTSARLTTATTGTLRYNTELN